MANVMLPIDPEKKDDIYYRYKMPAVQCKVESSGNGIKTVIPNIHELCSALNRPEEVLMKFFQFELGAQSTITEKDDKYLVMGKHTEERMQDLVYSFVKKFVLCGSCRNPETAVDLNAKRQTVSMTCGACGKTSKMDTADRAYTIMCQYYVRHPAEAKSGKGTAEARKKEGDAAAPEASQAAASAPAAPAVAEEKKAKQKATKSDLVDNRVDPIEVMAGHMRDAEASSAAAAKDGDNAAKSSGAAFHVTPAATEKLIAHVVRMLSEYNMEETFGVRLVLAGMFKLHAKEPLQAAKAYAPLLRRFSTVPELFFRQEQFDEKTLSSLLKREASIQSDLISECAITMARSKNASVPVAERMPVLLFLLFIEGIVKDTSILNYAANESVTPTVDPAVDKQMKMNTMALVEWLQIQKEDKKEAPVATVKEAA